ncbi:hypothetical protein [Plantactinospora sp. GCM10030261]|uniref:hypothetical protein n=1 Tax=Plantactinospora sp. GCM10030261 TaxID=3273420 RepID=UPI0036232F03
MEFHKVSGADPADGTVEAAPAGGVRREVVAGEVIDPAPGRGAVAVWIKSGDIKASNIRTPMQLMIVSQPAA